MPEASRALQLIVQPSQLVRGDASYDGYTLKYEDEVELVVTPAESRVDLNAVLETEVMPTTDGETKLWQAVQVNGFAGAYRKPAVQKWSSGAINRMPGVLEWSEPGKGAVPWVRYALLADLQLPELRAVAEELVPAETAP